MPEGRKCPECHSTHVIKAGCGLTRKGPKQRFKCMSCARTFYKGVPKGKG